MAAKTCLVTVSDIRGIQHTVKVQASSLYEAAVRGMCALKQDEWTHEAIRRGTTLTIEACGPTVKHTVTVQQVERWLDGATGSPNEQVMKSDLKQLLVK